MKCLVDPLCHGVFVNETTCSYVTKIGVDDTNPGIAKNEEDSILLLKTRKFFQCMCEKIISNVSNIYLRNNST